MAVIIKKGTNSSVFRLRNGKTIKINVAPGGGDLLNVISDADYDALMAEYGTFIKPRIISDKNPDGCFIVHNSEAAARAQSAEIGDKKDASAPIVIENKNKKTK